MAEGPADGPRKTSWEWSISGAYRYLLHQQASFGAVAATGAGALIAGAVVSAGVIVASPASREKAAAAKGAAEVTKKVIDPAAKLRATLVAIKALGVASATTGAFVYGVIAACDAGSDVRQVLTSIIRPSPDPPTEPPAAGKRS